LLRIDVRRESYFASLVLIFCHGSASRFTSVLDSSAHVLWFRAIWWAIRMPMSWKKCRKWRDEPSHTRARKCV